MTTRNASSGNGLWSPLASLPRSTHPHIVLLIGGQDHRHGLGMDWFDYGIRRGRQEAIDLMRPRNGFRLRPSVTMEGRPDTRKRKQRPALIEREPHHVFLLGLWVLLRCVLGEAVGR